MYMKGNYTWTPIHDKDIYTKGNVNKGTYMQRELYTKKNTHERVYTLKKIFTEGAYTWYRMFRYSELFTWWPYILKVLGLFAQ